MFYSHDLLGRKTPLGAIWTLAHGRKLSKGKIISINLREICDEILAPNVPHSLRLQGILIGGVVIVYNKQQAYLLEDLQEMMKRVKAAGRQPVAGDDDAAPSNKAATKGGSKRKRDRLTADIKDITVLDMDDLMGGDAAFFNDSAGDFLGLMGPLNSAFSSGSGGLGGLARAGHLRNNQLLLEPAEGGDDLFTMPSMDGETSEATRTTSNTQGGGRKGSKAGSRSRSVTFASGEALEQQHPHQQQRQPEEEEEEVYGGLGPNAHDWNLDEEMFDDVQYDLLDFMPQRPQPPPPPAAAAAADSEQTASARAASGAAQPGSTTTSGSELRGPLADPLDDAMELDDQQQLPPPDTEEQLPGEERTPGARGDGDDDDDVAAGAKDQRASAEEGQEEAPKRAKRAAGAKKARSKKRRADQAFLDDPDQLEIKSEVYRRWIADPSGLVNQELRAKGTASAVVLAASRAPPLDPCSLLDPGHPLMMGGNMLPAGLSMLAPMGNVMLCPELLELYRAPAALMQSPAAATGKKARGKAKAAPETPDSPEVNNSTGEGQLPRVQRVHRQPLPLEHVSGLPSIGRQAGADQQGDFPVEQDQEQEQDMLSNDEAHDQLMELPFGADIEVERLRAANTPSTGSLHMSSPGATGTAARLRQSASRRAGSSTSNDSALRPMQLDDEVQSGAAGLRSALRTSNSHQDEDGLFFGTGNLADLLPDVDLPPDEQQLTQQHRHSDGWQPGSSDRLLDGGASDSQFPLLEETEPSQPTQAGTQLESGLVTQASRLVLSIFRDRLQRADRAAGGDGVGEGSAGGGGAAAPSISMFDVMRDGRLSRSQAAKLFYQVCVTSSVGFIRVEQERPFADIRIAAGPSM